MVKLIVIDGGKAESLVVKRPGALSGIWGDLVTRTLGWREDYWNRYFCSLLYDNPQYLTNPQKCTIESL